MAAHTDLDSHKTYGDDIEIFIVDTNSCNPREDEIIPVLKSIGSHISKLKGSTFSKTLNSYAQMCSDRGVLPRCQMFLRNSKWETESEEELSISKRIIEMNDIHYYTHSPYIINLSNPVTKKEQGSESIEGTYHNQTTGSMVKKQEPGRWIMGLLKGDLISTSEIGGRGVVVHVGKYTDNEVDVSLDKMEKHIRETLPYATERCPLLLETAAGQGTELCVSIEDLSNFYKRFSENEKKVFKICIDTCHVFSAGYDPLDFIMEWNYLHPRSIGLVHFNDSMKEKGSRVDRHSYFMNPGGFIGVERLTEVATWCYRNKIDMITE